jgi:signal transduction histidine kinase
MALTAITSEPPDLVLLDILMPDMDGYQVCKQLKSESRTRDVPVIFMSALDEVMDKVKAFSVGGVDYITKPFQVDEVLARVDTHIKLQLLQKRLETQLSALRKVNNALQESNEELNAFAHTVAHDIKNPLASIIMSVDVLTRFVSGLSLDPAVVELVQGMGASARKTINIVDELLLLASVRQESVAKDPLDMGDIVQQAIKRLGWMVDTYQGRIELPENWPVALGYAPWVEEVWMNYISNGLKYGGSSPYLVLGGIADGEGTIRFWVRDNGPGIDQEKRSTLFTEFTRIGQTRTEGHGLGLSIVKRIMAKLRGQVGVESEVGRGSTFYFVLPAAGAQA